jgi:hypothetical protein
LGEVVSDPQPGPDDIMTIRRLIFEAINLIATDAPLTVKVVTDAAADACTAMLSGMAQELIVMMKDRDQWKANHDNQVAMKARHAHERVVPVMRERDEALARVRGQDIVINGLKQQIRNLHRVLDGYGLKQEAGAPEMAELPPEPKQDT